MQVQFLGKTQVAIKELLTIVKQRLGKSLKIDDLRLQPDHALSFMTTIADFKDVNCDFTNLGTILRHEHYIYLIGCTDRHMCEVVMESGLDFTTTSDNELGIVSANLQEWKTAIIAGCSDSSILSFREFTNKILLDMESRGLGQIFSHYRKSSLKDQTFKLTVK